MKLNAQEVPFGIWTEPVDPETRLTVPGLGNCRFYRFEGLVALGTLTIPQISAGGSHGPDKGRRLGRPRHIVATAYDEGMNAVTLVDEDLPDCLADRPVTLDLGGVKARAVSLLCDSQYPGEQAFGQFHSVPWTVPFTMLNDAEWQGELLDPIRAEPTYAPPLKQRRIAPAGAAGVEVSIDHYAVTYATPTFKVGFSLHRPLLTFLGWDALATGEIRNALKTMRRRRGWQWPACGPFARTLLCDVDAPLLGGSVELDGTRVFYHDVEIIDGWKVDAVFDVSREGIEVRLDQDVSRELRLLDGAAWNLTWDGFSGLPPISTFSRPIRGARRNGGIEPRGAWHLPGYGTLSFSARDDSSPVEIQTENAGFLTRLAMSGVQINTQHGPDGTIQMTRGRDRASMSLRVENVEVRRKNADVVVPQGIRQAWGSVFAFRPEAAGFSNNGFSTNCKSCMQLPADLAAYTDCSDSAFDVIEMLKYSAALALQGGPGYGACLDHASDTAPALLLALGRIHQVRPDVPWLSSLWPYVEKHVRHILTHQDDSGMYVNRLVSGNSGERKWSSNAVDTTCYGHIDGYSNAFAYVALRGCVTLCRAAGEDELAGKCAEAADRLKAAYVPTLFNPETGWLGAWRSRDGELHDYAFPMINGMAVCFGLAEGDQARTMIEKLEAERVRMGCTDFTYALPLQLRPVARKDYSANTSGEPQREDGWDTFGVFVNGGLSPPGSYYYLRALSMLGFEVADQVCEQILDSFAKRRFDGGPWTGTEAWSWEGLPTGYEGTLVHSYHVLLACAQHLGVVETLEPEWWPGE